MLEDLKEMPEIRTKEMGNHKLAAEFYNRNLNAFRSAIEGLEKRIADLEAKAKNKPKKEV